tara:strand:- start:1194 stop:2348 length:1155 start_codon:yes stop_codon:yes gene_type:complete
MHDFEDIRPYRDEEVSVVLRRLVADKEFQDVIIERQFPRLLDFFPKTMRLLFRLGMTWSVRNIKTVYDFQRYISFKLKKILSETTDQYTFSGIDGLKASKAYLFMSNHRDIALDPAIIILGLVQSGRDSLRIAIGDNLLTKQFASDLMRLNRSFIVKRSLSALKEKMFALRQLSSYIRNSIYHENVSVWIAQAEGRAKDGHDRTETALLKMLALSRSNKQTFGESIKDLCVVPVAIAYEYDPCAFDKAKQLKEERLGNTYVKGDYEDLESIKKGFIGYKGRVHVSFGNVIDFEVANPEELSNEIDRQIISLFQLFPSHIIAWQLLNPDKEEKCLQNIWPDEDWEAARRKFARHVAQFPLEYRDIVLKSYAAPVFDQLASGDVLA